MDADFWHGKWKNADIAFHKDEPNPLLLRYFDKLALEKGSRIFLPLCGKTLDIGWLLSNHFRVVGAELSEVAVKQLFDQLGLQPEVTETDFLKRYTGNGIDLFVGDILTLSAELLGPVEAIYDRAALVALPEATRIRYAQHITAIADAVPQLLVCFEYDQAQLEGPPFSVSNQEVNQLYGGQNNLTLLESSNLVGGLKGKCTAKENVWLIEPKRPDGTTDEIKLSSIGNQRK